MELILHNKAQYFLCFISFIFLIFLNSNSPLPAQTKRETSIFSESDTLLDFPKINRYGKSCSDFIHLDWVALETSFACINEDTLQDFVMVIETKDTINYLEESHYEHSENDSVLVKSYNYAKPRILIVAFKQKKGGMFELSCQSNTAVIASNGGRFSDPYAGISAEKGQISIEFISWGYDNWHLSHTYRLTNGLWTLSEAHKSSVNASFGEKSDYNLESGILEYNYERLDFLGETDSIIASRKEEYFKIIKPDSIILMENFKPWSLEVVENNYF
jgi:hypothetical protein